MRRKQEHQDEVARKKDPPLEAGKHTPLIGKPKDKEEMSDEEEADEEDKGEAEEEESEEEDGCCDKAKESVSIAWSRCLSGLKCGGKDDEEPPANFTYPELG